MLKENGNETCDSKIVTSEKELIQLSNKGYDCQIIGTDKCMHEALRELYLERVLDEKRLQRKVGVRRKGIN